MSRVREPLALTLALALALAALAGVLLPGPSPAAAAALPRPQRAAQYSAPAANDSICKETTPCGWAVYTPFIRRVDYFIKNLCACPDDLSCMRASDDLSVSAYVYQCLPTRPTTTAAS